MTARYPGAGPYLPDRRSLEALREAVQSCRGCPLYADATQAVFGAGPADGAARTRRRAAGRSGRPSRQSRSSVRQASVLDRAVEAAGIDRGETYVTNAVKHFKWKARGPRRIHDKPRWSEQVACRPWLELELDTVSPRGIVLLGATAAQSLLGRDFRVTTTPRPAARFRPRRHRRRDDPSVGGTAGTTTVTRRSRGSLPISGSLRLRSARRIDKRRQRERPLRCRGFVTSTVRAPVSPAGGGAAASRIWTSADGRFEIRRRSSGSELSRSHPRGSTFGSAPRRTATFRRSGPTRQGAASTCTTPRGASIATARSSMRCSVSPRRCRRPGAGSDDCSASPPLTRERVLAFAVALLDRGLFRVGGEEYANDYGSHGLATLERRHVSLFGRDGVAFAFEGKSGRFHELEVSGRPLRRAASDLLEARRRGRFLAYRNGRGWHEVRSEDVNAFLKDPRGRGVLGEGLPYLACDGACRSGSRSRRAGARSRRPAPGRFRHDRGGCNRPWQHSGGLPSVVRRPEGLRPLQGRRHYRSPAGRSGAPVAPSSAGAGAGSSRPARRSPRLSAATSCSHPQPDRGLLLWGAWEDRLRLQAGPEERRSCRAPARTRGCSPSSSSGS